MSCWEADFVDAGYDGEEVTVRDLKYLKQIGRWGNRNAKSGFLYYPPEGLRRRVLPLRVVPHEHEFDGSMLEQHRVLEWVNERIRDFKKAGVEGPPKTACGGVVMANEPSGVPPTLLWPALLMSHDELQAFRHTDDGRHFDPKVHVGVTLLCWKGHPTRFLASRKLCKRVTEEDLMEMAQRWMEAAGVKAEEVPAASLGRKLTREQLDVCFVAALSYGLAYSAVEGPQAKVWLTSELSNTNHTHFNPQVVSNPWGGRVPSTEDLQAAFPGLANTQAGADCGHVALGLWQLQRLRGLRLPLLITSPNSKRKHPNTSPTTDHQDNTHDDVVVVLDGDTSDAASSESSPSNKKLKPLPLPLPPSQPLTPDDTSLGEGGGLSPGRSSLPVEGEGGPADPTAPPTSAPSSASATSARPSSAPASAPAARASPASAPAVPPVPVEPVPLPVPVRVEVASPLTASQRASLLTQLQHALTHIGHAYTLACGLEREPLQLQIAKDTLNRLQSVGGVQSVSELDLVHALLAQGVAKLVHEVHSLQTHSQAAEAETKALWKRRFRDHREALASCGLSNATKNDQIIDRLTHTIHTKQQALAQTQDKYQASGSSLQAMETVFASMPVDTQGLMADSMQLVRQQVKDLEAALAAQHKALKPLTAALAALKPCLDNYWKAVGEVDRAKAALETGDLQASLSTLQESWPKLRLHVQRAELGAGLKTLLVTDVRCKRHNVPPNHAEQPERVDLAAHACDTLTAARPLLFDRKTRVEDSSPYLPLYLPAEQRFRTEVLRVHSGVYLEKIRQRGEVIGEQWTELLLSEGDTDTFGSQRTLEAAGIGLAAALQAVDAVVEGSVANALVACRPPGHHAGRRGEVESDGSRALTSGGGGRTRRSLNGPPNPHTGSTDEGSSTSLGLGFCVINYVAAAAMHAVAKHSQAIHRVTVIDIDLHHGNGTEEILCGGGDGGGVYQFISVHASNMYPFSGPHDPRRHPYVVNLPIDGPVTPQAFTQQWPAVQDALQAFRPDLVLLSAGFDGHVNDPIRDQKEGGQAVQRGFLRAVDYFCFASWLRRQCESVCVGRCVAVLEGGYSVKCCASPSPSTIPGLASVTGQHETLRHCIAALAQGLAGFQSFDASLV